jgi:hypothetical protein
MGRPIDLEHHPLGCSSLSSASMLVGPSLARRRDPLGSEDLADLLPAGLDPFYLHELLAQVVIVKAPVLPLR